MAKFCINCGAQLADDAGFCTSCGTPQNNTQQPQQGAANISMNKGMDMSSFTQAAGNMAQSAGSAVKNTFDGVSFDSVKGAMNMNDIKNVTKTKNKNTIIGLAACGVVVLILIIVLVSLLAGAPYKKPVDNFFKAVSKGDGEAMKEAFPDYYNEYMEDNMPSKYDSVEEYYEDELLDNLTDMLEDEVGEDPKVTYKVIKKTELKKSDLSDLEDDIEKYYDEEVEVSKGYQLKIKMKTKGDDDDKEDTEKIKVYKIDDKWCIDGMGGLF